MKRIFWIILVVVVVAVGAGTLGVTYWMKPGDNIERADALPIKADDLVAAYGRNEKMADQTYLGKPLAVFGTVEKVAQNQDGQTTVLLSSSDPMTGVFCTLRDKGATATQGTTITVRGFCSGKTTDVVLRDCIIAKY